jgi:acyl carrier protein
MKSGSENGNASRSAPTIQEWMILRLSEAIGVDPGQIDPRLPFASYGLSSLTAYRLTGDLAEWIGRDLPATLFWEYPTIFTLSQHLAGETGPNLASVLDSRLGPADAKEPEKD